MKSMFKKATLVGILGGVLIAAGCGGGGGGGGSSSSGFTYSGSTAPAAVTASNAESLSATSSEAVSQAVTDSEAASANPFAVVVSGTASNGSTVPQAVTDVTRQIEQALPTSSLPIGVTETGTLTSDQLNAQLNTTLFCGGWVSYSITSDGSSNSSGSFTYHDLCFNMGTGSDQASMNGTVTFSETSTQYTATYSNFTLSANGQTYTYNTTLDCTLSPTYSCTSSSSYAGSDGQTYKMQNVTVSGSASSGYTVNATFFNPTYGSVTIQATGILLGCSNGSPSAGTVTITGGSGGSATITFRGDCTGFDGTWTDKDGATGTLSYSWPA